MELDDDPLVLEAALALVDEWCAKAEKRKENSRTSSPTAVEAAASMSPQGLRKRAREELTWLQASVRERVVTKEALHPLSLEIALSSWDESGGDEDDEEECRIETVVSSQQRVRARRLLQAVEAYNRMFAASRRSFGSSMTLMIRPVDDERILVTLRSRLDALAQIAQANRLATKQYTGFDTTPTLTGTGFRAQAHFNFKLPFKQSLVTSVMWEMNVEQFADRQLSVPGSDEFFTVVEACDESPWGLIASTNVIACRQIYLEDGSVIHLRTMVGSGTKDLCDSSDSPNLLAGCVVKQAGWACIGRDPVYNGVQMDRPLVNVETSVSIVAETMPGHVMSRDRLLRFWDAVTDPSNDQERGPTALENRLMNRQLTTKA